jgi:FtsP/CotA-like multicopper oxidase with cupredoxin domain
VSNKVKDKKKTKATANGSGMSRRTMMKGSAAVGAAAILTSRRSFADDTFPTPPAEPVNCTPSSPVQSPPTQPFVNALPIMPIAIPTILNPAPTLNADTANGEAVRAAHQDWFQFFPFVQYHFSLQGGMHNFDPTGGAIPSTYIWGYDGIYPGPTIINVYGVPIVVRFSNNLPNPNVGFGDNNHTTHLHNGHTASESDGYAGDFWPPGLFKDHHYPNVYAGFNANPPIGDPLEAQFTYWYHDHRHSFTATNNYRGLNGQYIIYNELDNGTGIPGLGNLGLPGPYGLFDIPLFLTDKTFCPDGGMVGTTPDGAAVGGVGDKFIVNGVIQPFLNVYTRKYRFRITNTGPTRIWLLNLVDNNGNTIPFQVVCTHGNLLQNPVTIPNAEDTQVSATEFGGGPGLNVFVSERFDVIFDFTNATAGTSWYLTNNAAMFVNNSAEPVANGTVPVGNVVMAFNIVGASPFGPDLSVVPATLTQYPNIETPLANLAGTRIWNFNFDVVGNAGDSPTGAGVGVYNGPFTPLNSPASGIGAGDAAINTSTAKVFNVNGLVFDPLRVDAQIQQGTAETWLIRDRFPAAGWVHPVHIHLEEGRVLDRRVQVVDNQNNISVTNHFVSPLWSGRRDVYPIAGKPATAPTGNPAVSGGTEVLIFLQFRDWFGKYMIHCHNLDHEDDTMIATWEVVSGASSTSTSPFNDLNTPNTANFNQPNTGQTGVATQFFPTLPEGVEANSGAQPNITPALQTLPDSLDLNNVPNTRLMKGSRKGVKA